MRIQTLGCVFVLAVATASAFGAKVDSTFIQPLTANKDYKSTTLWLHGKPANGGGFLSFSNQTDKCTSCLNVDTNGYVIGGVDFGDGVFTISGYPITLSGVGVIRGTNASGARFANSVIIPEGSTMTKCGAGKVTMEKGFEGQGKLVIAEGTIITAPTDKFMVGGDLELKAGQISWYRPNSAEPLAVACGNVTYGPDRARIIITKGDKLPSYVATMASLTQGDAGGFLQFHISSGIDALGDTEKIKVQDRVSDDGFIDASVIARGVSQPGAPVVFLKYDADDGFVPAETNAFVVGQSADGTVAVIDTDTAITADTSVSALLVRDAAQVTIASGVTLTVGDGVHPAGVAFAGEVANKTIKNFNGPGTLAFKEGAPGYVYVKYDIPSDNADWTNEARLYLGPDGLTITGNKGVTFAGIANSSKEYGTFCIRGNCKCNWTGGTSVLSCRLHLDQSASFTSLPGPVRVLGSRNFPGGGLRQNNGMTLNQDYCLSGDGLARSSASHVGLFCWGGSPTVTFSKKLTLLTDISYHCDNAAANTEKACVVAAGGITGTGGIDLMGGKGDLDIAGPSDYAGPTRLAYDSSLVRLFITGAGTPGLGPISTAGSKNQIIFRKNDGTVAKCDITTEGPITFTDTTNVVFTGTVSAGSASLCDTVTVHVGAKGANFGKVTGCGYAKIVPAEENGVLRVGVEGQDLVIPVALADAADGTRLNVEKVTSDTVTLYGADFSGDLRVREGTVKLANDLFASPDLRYRLDASDEDSFEFDENDGVTKWTSIADPEYSFTSVSGYTAPTRTDTLNGKKVVTFVRGETVKASTWMEGSAACRQQTAIFVVRPRANKSNCGLYGQYTKDKGLRLTGTTWSRFAIQGGAFCSGGLYLDGKLTADGKFTDNTWQIVSALNSGAGSCPILFTPSIGSYYKGSDSDNRFFNGDLAEMVVFDRQLDEVERQLVENALAEKWGLPVPHPGLIGGYSSRFAKPFALDVSLGATFDLNGVDLTVASLSGVGTIVNSSETPATLTVTGDNGFKGSVSGKVTIAQHGAGSVEHTVGEGVTLAIDGDATTTLTGSNGGIVTDGMVYWLDAMKAETVLTNAEGRVTNWVSRAGQIVGFQNTGRAKSAKGIWYTPPVFEPSVAAWDGRPAVHFTEGPGGIGTNMLASIGSATVRTVIFVGIFETLKNPSGGNIGFWNTSSSERGFFPLSLSNGRMTLRTFTGTTFHRWGYLQHALGVNSATGEEEFFDQTEETGTFNSPDKFVLVSEIDDSANNASWFKDSTYLLGCGYHGPWRGWFGEAIAYDRCLNAEEVRTMEEYLMNKWMRGTPTGPYVETRPVLAEGSALLVSGGGSVDLGGQAATLSRFGGSDGGISNFSSLTVEDAFVFDVVGGRVKKLTVDGDLVIGSQAVAEFLNGDALDRAFQMQPALEVTGDVSGGALKTTVGLPQKWSWERAGNIWSVIRNGMLLLIR